MSALAFAMIALLAQPTPSDRDALGRLDSALLKLTDTKPGDALKSDITSEIMALAEKAHQPTRPTVAGFVDDLGDTLAGRRLSGSEISQLTGPIYHVLHSAGEGTFRLQGYVRDAERALIAVKVNPSKARTIAAKLTAIGREVRGPDDMPR